MVLNFELAYTFMLVLMRMTGMLVVNPILGRQNVPTMANMGIALTVTLALYRTVVPAPISDPTLLQFLPLVFKELLVGIIASFLLRMFMSILVVGGELIDMQMGLSMAKAFDPGTNSSLSLTSQIFNILFILTFFVSNNHLTYIQMVSQSFQLLPVGDYLLSVDVFYFIPQLLTTILLFAVKLCLPIVVIEIITTFAVGIIMRIIPQINVFVLNIQLKLAIGLIVLFLLIPTFTAFMENIILISNEQIWTVWQNMVQAPV